MGDSDTPPTLSELVDTDPDENYWAERTTITVSRATKQRLDAHRDEKPWDHYLEQLRRESADPLTLTDAEQVADAVSGEVELDVPNYDDVKNACAAALREELPVEEMGGQR